MESCLNFLCWYHKQTDIYYSTWSFENVAKYCQFQFLDPPPILLPVSELLLSVSRPPPQILLPVSVFRPLPQNCQFQFLDPPKILLPVSELPVSVFRHPPPPQILLPVSELPVSVFRPPQNCQFQFIDPPPKILLPVSVFRPPPKYCCQFQFQLKTLQLIIFNFRGVVSKYFIDPPQILKGNGVVFKNFTINSF